MGDEGVLTAHMGHMETITVTGMAILTLPEDGADMEATAVEAGEDSTSMEAKVVLKEVLVDLVEEARELELTQSEVVEDSGVEEEDEVAEVAVEVERVTTPTSVF